MSARLVTTYGRHEELDYVNSEAPNENIDEAAVVNEAGEIAQAMHYAYPDNTSS